MPEKSLGTTEVQDDQDEDIVKEEEGETKEEIYGFSEGGMRGGQGGMLA